MSSSLRHERNVSMVDEPDDGVLLRIEDLSVLYRSKMGVVRAVDRVNLSMRRNRLVAVVGESGCGKSTLALSIIRLLPIPPAEFAGGRIEYKGVDLLRLEEGKMLDYRGTEIAMIFQEPLSSLNPVYRIGDQVAEAVAIRESRIKPSLSRTYSYNSPAEGLSLWSRLLPRVSKGMAARGDDDEVIEALKLVRIPDPEHVTKRYPFELSGGMRQRVMIAMALSEKPSLLIADEPTSAIDVTTQAQVLKLMKNLMNEVKTSILLITHDLAVASQVADEIAVMYAGDVVEFADVYELFSKPIHPYTKGLVACIPSTFKDEGLLTSIPGVVPDLRSPPQGCKFAPRCPNAKPACCEQKPGFRYVSPTHVVACGLV